MLAAYEFIDIRGHKKSQHVRETAQDSPSRWTQPRHLFPAQNVTQVRLRDTQVLGKLLLTHFAFAPLQFKRDVGHSSISSGLVRYIDILLLYRPIFDLSRGKTAFLALFIDTDIDTVI
jgi:hypothetical protein